jgi:hypothetical protein
MALLTRLGNAEPNFWDVRTGVAPPLLYAEVRGVRVPK